MQDGGIDDPTLDVTDPAWTGDEEDLALDLSRRPRPDAMASWVAAAEGVDPFKASIRLPQGQGCIYYTQGF